jgi:HNH endonuclease
MRIGSGKADKSCARKKLDSQAFPRLSRTDQWIEKMAEHDFRCYWCGHPLDSSDLTQDHLTPTARGGSREMFNVVPCCFRCNCEKNVKTAREYREYKKRIGKEIPHWQELYPYLIHQASLLSKTDVRASILLNLLREPDAYQSSFLDVNIRRLCQALKLPTSMQDK